VSRARRCAGACLFSVAWLLRHGSAVGLAQTSSPELATILGGGWQQGPRSSGPPGASVPRLAGHRARARAGHPRGECPLQPGAGPPHAEHTDAGAPLPARENQDRFAFERKGERSFHGTKGVEDGFTERVRPTLVAGGTTEGAPVNGSDWSHTAHGTLARRET